MPEDPPTLEVCVDTCAGLAAAQNDADRIELCSALGLGGLTPGAGLLSAVRDSRVPVHAMIRPRAGGFHYDAADRAACLADIAAAKAAGCAGIVIGAAQNGQLDHDTLAAFVTAAEDLPCTLHRVIDQLDDPLTALDTAMDLGISRVLSSGGAVRAVDGLDRLAAMQTQGAGRITIMAGSGITPDTVARIARATGIRHFHASCSVTRPSDPADRRLGFAGETVAATDPETIGQLRAAIARL